MSDPSPSIDPSGSRYHHAQQRHQRSYHRDRYLAAVLGALLVVAVLPFGTVHEAALLVVAVLVAMVALVVSLVGKEGGGPSSLVIGVTGAAAAVYAASLLWLVPVPDALRSAWMPTLGSLVAESRGLAGSVGGPLALYPRGAAIGVMFGVAMCMLTGASGFLFRRSRRSGRLGAFLVAVAVVTTLVAGAHTLVGAHAPWGLVGFTAPRIHFFGPFVYPNDGGLLCAALIPVAIAVGAREEGRFMVPFGLAAMVLAAGAWGSDSRTAVILVPVGSALFVAMRGPTWSRWAVGAAALVSGVGVLAWGPARAVDWLTASLEKQNAAEGAEMLAGRPSIWVDAVRVWLRAPLGVGLAGFEDARRTIKVDPHFESAMHAHQEALESLVEVGPLALVLWFAAALVLILGVRTALRRTDDRGALSAGYASAFSCILIFAMVDFPFRVGALAILTALVAGAVLGLAHEEAASARWVGAWRVGQVASASLVLVLAALVGLGANRAGELANPAARQADGDGWMAHSAAPDDEAMVAARAHYLQGIGARPLSASLALRLANLEGRARHPELARRWLSLSSELDPTSPYPWRNLARVARADGRLEDARVAWRRLLALEVSDAEWLQRAEEALRGAPVWLDEVKSVVPASRWCLLAASLRPDRAADADALFKDAGDSPGCRLRWAYSLHGRGRPADALDVLADEPGCEADRLRVLANESVGRHDQARAVATEWMRRCGSGDAQLRLSLARARLRSEKASDRESGQTILQALISEDDGNVAAHRALAEGCFDAGDRACAREHYRALVGLGVATAAERARLDEINAGR
jgi:O-antigen ligase